MRQKRIFTIDEMELIETRLTHGISITAIAKELHCKDKMVSQYIKDTFGTERVPKVGRKANPNKKHKGSPIGGTVNEVTNETSDECIKPADTYLDIPTDLKASSYEEAGELVDEMVRMMEENKGKYLNLKYHLMEEKDCFNNNGIVGHTCFDVVVPGLQLIIVNVKNKEEQAAWSKKYPCDGFRLTEYLNKNNIHLIIYNFNGVEGILKELEEYAAWRIAHTHKH